MVYDEGMTKGTRVVGYVRVSTAEQAASGAGLEAQRAAIQFEADVKGWELVEIVEDGGYSAKDLRRPGVQRVTAAPAPSRRAAEHCHSAVVLPMPQPLQTARCAVLVHLPDDAAHLVLVEGTHGH
jgi:hypothetical protein